MRNTTSLMVDIETMGVTPDSAILSIGACAFDEAGTDTFETITDKFYCTISLESNEAAGRRFMASTMEWWLKQSTAAQQALFAPPIKNLKQAIVSFRMWVQELKPSVQFIWANDPDFDLVMLKHAASGIGEQWPWSFAIHRSCRTIKHLAWPEDDCPDFRAGTVHHRADDDAVAQALMVQAGYRRLVLENANV